MKISVITPTYNRANLLERLYESLIKNSKYGIEIEWLIMDDGSNDNTKEVIDEYIKQDRFHIVYSYQENQGKMEAINHLVGTATGDLMIECDSDDFFTEDAFKIIQEEYEKYKSEKNIYALCFLKYDENKNNIGNAPVKGKTTMFALYFKQGKTGETALAFFTPIRKQYQYIIEKQEKFSTEARMYHQMDLKYQMICINKPIMICEYQKDGYTKNIKEIFKKAPLGHFEYFKEIFQQDMKGVSFKKRLYIIKHYILFSVLTNKKQSLKNIKGIDNQMLFLLLYIPGYIKTKKVFFSQ